MHFRLLATTLCCILLIANGLPSSTKYVIHERRTPHPDWKIVGRLEKNLPIPLRIGLKQQNLDSLPGHLLSVSDPNSPSYGQHWSSEKVVNTFAPSPEGNKTIHAWLLEMGLTTDRLKFSHNKAWIEVVNCTVSEAEQLLNAEYYVFEHESGEQHAACHSYSIPFNVAQHVDFVTPTVQPILKVSEPKHKRSLPTRNMHQGRDVVKRIAPSGCDTTVVPDCLTSLYNMSYTPVATDRNTFGISGGFTPATNSRYSDTYLQSDLDMFFRNFSPKLVGKSPVLVSIDGGTIAVDPTTDVGEDGWILQYAMTLVQPQPVTFLQVGNSQTGPVISFNEWLDAVDGSYCTFEGGDDFTFDPQLPNPFPGGLNEHSCGTVRSPNVVSNSQADHEYRFPQFYLQRQCNEFAKLGLMGVTVLYAAGNTGTAGAQSGYCLDENGAMNLNATNFNPAWPASCPWVTIVGGTQVKPGANLSSASAEEVWNQDLTMGFFESGGGGFSNRFPAPEYQQNAVSAYLKYLRTNDPSVLNNLNVKGRAYPDLSANANMFVNIDNGSISIDSGTSGAVPVVASIITLVNDARISAGKKPVGFINPAIYSPGFANAFRDITDGTSQGCKGLQGQRDGGFKATNGWDAATGVGTPNLGVLIEKWLKLP